MAEHEGEPGPVVIGFDGSAAGADALTLGTWFAGALGVNAVVAVVHPGPATISPARVDAEWVADRHRLAEEILDEARELLGGTDVVIGYRAVASPSAAHGLHDLVEELDASIVVVGSRSTGEQERLFAGSTADRLLSGSTCPVAVAPSGIRGRELAPLGTVGVAYIDAAEARGALAFAVTLARRAGARLRAYTVVPGEAEVMPMLIGSEPDQAYVEMARESYGGALDAALAALPPELGATGEVLTGDTVDTLAELGPPEVDVLVCGSRGYGPARRVLLGGVSARLVRQARGPVIVVPRED